MLVQVSEVMNIKDGIIKHMIPLDFCELKRNGVTFPVAEKLPVQLTLTNLGDKKLLVEASGKLTLRVPCDRCLQEVLIPFLIQTEKELKFDLTEEKKAEELEEASYLTGYDLDVDLLIYEEVLIGFPMKVLCSKNCKGICQICGADLNQGDCGCDHTELDPRMSVIRDIFNNFKEV